MIRSGRILGICGLAALLSVPLTLFLWDWQFTWVALAKLIFGLAALAFWLVTNGRRLRQTFQGRSVFYGSFAALFSVLLLFGLVVLNYTFYVHPVEFDLTEEQIFSLSPQTEDVLESLEAPVEVLAFYSPRERPYGQVRSFLDRYRAAAERFDYRFIDPTVRLDLVDKHQINLDGPRLLFRYQGREQRLQLGAPGQSGVEEAITGALLELTRADGGVRLCFTTGHGERALEGDDPSQSMTAWARDLAGEGYATERLALLEQPQVPEHCSAVVIAGARHDLTAGELDSLRSYLDGGGRLLVLAGSGDSDSLNAVLAPNGIVLGAGTVVHPDGRSPLEVVTDPRHSPKTHPVFARFFHGGRVRLRQLQAVFPLARPVRRRAPPASLQVVELVFSGERAWAETDPVADGGEIRFDGERDRRGPISLAATAEVVAQPGAPASGRRLAVFGSSMVAVDAAYQAYPFNRNLVLNSLAWLLRAEKQITIRPRLRAASLLRLDEAQLKFITFFSSDILPLVILALGLTIWQLRRWA